MPDIPIVLPQLWGGISQQAPHVRHPEQVEDAVNWLLSVAHGAAKRPGTDFIATISGLTAAADYRLHEIHRDDAEQYLVIYKADTQRVFDLSGNEIPVTISSAAETYLALNSPDADELRFVTIADYTIIVNTTVEVAAKRSSDYTIAKRHADFDQMISESPDHESYHATKNATAVEPAGYWQYDNDGSQFAKWVGGTVSGSYATVNTTVYGNGSRNPMGFKVTFKDNDGNNHAFNVSANFIDDLPDTMEGIAKEFEQALQDAGARDALIAWEWDSTTTGHFVITAPYRGSTAEVVGLTANDDGAVDDLTDSAGTEPFVYADGTASNGTGTPVDDEKDVLSRWTRVAPPDQAEAALDQTTMPVQMVRRPAPIYEETIKADGPDGYWRFGESSGSDALNEVSGTDGTYTNTPTLGEAGALAGDSDTSVRFTRANSEYVDFPSGIGIGAEIGNEGGLAIEAWIKIASGADGGRLCGSDIGATNAFNIDFRDDGTFTEAVQMELFDNNGDGANMVAENIGVYDNEWHHVVCQYSVSTNAWTVWVDGESKTVGTTVSQAALVGTGDWRDFEAGGVENFAIATAYNGVNPITSATFDGHIDEFAIYIGTLTDKTVEKHYKRGANSFTFDIDAITWEDRKTGTENSNPVPSLWKNNRKIADLALHRNRLVLAGDENVVFSQVGDFFNFFLFDDENIQDSDPIDVALSSEQVTLIDYIVPFRKALVIFTKAGRQFELNAPEALTPDTAAITPSTAYQALGVRPQRLGTFLYFAADTEEGTALYEYFYDDSQVSNTAADVSAHIPRLLPDDLTRIAASTNNGTVVALNADDDDLYVYRMFWRGNQKEQSAWARWSFDESYRILDLVNIENHLYMLVESNSQYFLESLSLAMEDAHSGAPWPVHLDRKQQLTGSHSGGTTEWELGFDDTTIDYAVGSSGATAVTPKAGDDSKVEASGDLSGEAKWVGRSFTSTLELSRQFMRQQGVPDLNSKLTLSKVHVAYLQSAYLQLKLSQSGYQDQTETLDESASQSYGILDASMNGDQAELTLEIINDNPRPGIATAVQMLAHVEERL